MTPHIRNSICNIQDTRTFTSSSYPVFNNDSGFFSLEEEPVLKRNTVESKS